MDDVVGTTAVVLVAAAFLALLQSRFSTQERSLVWLSFSAHVAASVAMVWVTREVLGGGDMIIYQRVGCALADKLGDDFSNTASTLLEVMMHREVPLPVPAHGIASATGAMHAVSGFIVLIAGQSVYADCAFVSFVAFFSSLAMYRALREELPVTSSMRLLVGCMLVPSVVFWSSALLKESIVISGLCAMIFGGQRIARHRQFFSGGAILLLGLAIVGMLKAYILVPFGMAAGMWFYVVALRKERELHLKALNVVVGSVLALALVIGTGRLFPQYSLESFEAETAQHQQIGMRTTGDANYELVDDPTTDLQDRSLRGQIEIAPLAIATALFRPLIFEARNAQMLVNSLETTVMLGLAITALFKAGLRGFLSQISRSPLLMFCAVFVLGMGLGVGLATVNLGTLSRYRMPFMPFMTIFLLELADVRLMDSASSRVEAQSSVS